MHGEGQTKAKRWEVHFKAAKNGYQTVLSNGFYIDLMLGREACE
jgi:hypothetical protein